MPKILSMLAIVFIAIVFFFYKNSNPILHTDPDTFAEAVNQFSDPDMGNQLSSTCLNLYAYPDDKKKSAFYSPLIEHEIKQSCSNNMVRLAAYLNQMPDYKNVTLSDLENQSTWLHYFKSKKSHGSL